MRDLVLAEQFEGDEVMFACQELDGHIMDKIPYPIMILPSMDVDALIIIVKQEQIDMLVIDHYGIAYEDEKRIKEETGVKIFVLDDTYERHFCDVLLNHNISANADRYHDKVPTGCELRCGSQYTLIRDEFKKVKVLPRKKNVNPTVFIAMGGSDHSGITLEILKILKLYKEIQVIVVTTSSNKKLKQLKQFAYLYKWVELHVDTDEMAKLMQKSDLAIVTPSVIVHEVLYLKKPFIAIKTVENQDDIYQYLRKKRFHVVSKLSHTNRILKKVL